MPMLCELNSTPEYKLDKNVYIPSEGMCWSVHVSHGGLKLHPQLTEKLAGLVGKLRAGKPKPTVPFSHSAGRQANPR